MRYTGFERRQQPLAKTAEPALSLPKGRGFGQTPAHPGESCRPPPSGPPNAILWSASRGVNMDARSTTPHRDPVARPIADPVY